MQRLPGLTVFILLCSAMAATASECLLYEDLLHIDGGKNTLNDAEQILYGGNNIAYLVTGGGQSTGSFFVSLNISNPANPATLGWIECGFKKALNLDSYDRYVYYGLGDSYPPGANGHIFVISVFTPSVPWIVTPVSTGSWPLDLLVNNGQLYAGTYGDGLQIYGLSNPAQPAVLSTTDLGGRVWSLAASGNLLYAGVDAQGVQSIRILDVSDPALPIGVGSVPIQDIPREMIIDQNHLLVAADELGLQAYDLVDPLQPLLVASPSAGASCVALDRIDGFLYSAGAGSGVQLFDLADPGDPQLLGTLRLHQDVWDVLARPDHALLLGLDVISVDVSPAAAALPLAVAPLSDTPTDLAVAGDIAFVTTHGDNSPTGLAIYDISDPGNPQLLDSYPTGGQAFNVAVSGSTAYLSHFDTLPDIEQVHVKVLNVSNPADPQLRGSIQFDSHASTDLEVAGSRIYVTDGSETVRIIDVSDPDNPQVVGSYSGTPLAEPKDLEIQAHRLYVASGAGGVAVFDVAGDTPQLLGSYAIDGGCNEVALRGGLVYVATNQQGLVILDLSNPAAPQLVGQTGANIALGLLSVEMAWTHAYASYKHGIEVFDVSNPAAPRMMGSLGLPGAGESSHLTLHGDLILGTASEAGLVWLPLNCGELTAVDDQAPPGNLALGAWPNPFNPHATLSFNLPDAGKVRLTIHDVGGRRVRTLADGLLPAGPHLLVWDGRDERGLAAPSGIYMARLEAGAIAGTAKLTLLR